MPQIQRLKELKFLIVPAILPSVLQSCGGGDLGAGAASSGTPSSSATLQVTGTVYERVSSTSYSQASGPLAPAVACDSITLKDASTACNADGTFSLTATAPDYEPIIATRAGYIPTPYTVNGSGSQTVPIGLYAESTVTPRPGFVKGMVYLDLQTSYPLSYWAQVMGDPVTRMSAELVSYVEVGFNHSCNTTSHTLSVSSAHPDYPDWTLATQAELAPMVSTVHAAGAAFNLWLGVVSVNECAGSVMFDWPGTDSAFWDSWFAAYRLILLERTQVAKNLGIEWITLGHTMGYVSARSASR